MTAPYRGRLRIACPDRPGIVAAISDLIFRAEGNIVSLDQYSEDPVHGMFFMRVECEFPTEDHADKLAEGLSRVAGPLAMRWQFTPAERVKELAVLVSRELHCLQEILWQCRTGEIAAKVALILSNHRDAEELAATFAVPFHYVPVDKEQKALAERRMLRLLPETLDLVVLARYMQVLSPDFVQAWPQRIINIHHSFLPAFAGSRPYHQAWERGVKLIGATAHYVTAELDAGPIIEQDVQRVDHRHRVEDLKRLGRHVERMVLARAVRWHVEDRVLIHQERTVVFP